MTNVWGATSTTDDVLSGIDLHGKRIIVTGVSAGIGVETARALAAHGAHVTGAARDLEKAEAATAQVRKDAASKAAALSWSRSIWPVSRAFAPAPTNFWRAGKLSTWS